MSQGKLQSKPISRRWKIACKGKELQICVDTEWHDQKSKCSMYLETQGHLRTGVDSVDLSGVGEVGRLYEGQ